MARYDQQIAGRLMSDLMRDFGLTRPQAAGFVGNLAHESGGFNTLQEISPLIPGSRGGYGYAQWTGGRRRQYERWSRERGLNPASYEANYGFLKHELTNTQERSVLTQLRKARSAREAALIVRRKFLRPGIPHDKSRIRFAELIADDPLGPVTETQIARAEKGGRLPIPQERPTSILAGLLGVTPAAAEPAPGLLGLSDDELPIPTPRPLADETFNDRATSFPIPRTRPYPVPRDRSYPIPTPAPRDYPVPTPRPYPVPQEAPRSYPIPTPAPRDYPVPGQRPSRAAPGVPVPRPRPATYVQNPPIPDNRPRNPNAVGVPVSTASAQPISATGILGASSDDEVIPYRERGGGGRFYSGVLRDAVPPLEIFDPNTGQLRQIPYHWVTPELEQQRSSGGLLPEVRRRDPAISSRDDTGAYNPVTPYLFPPAVEVPVSASTPPIPASVAIDPALMDPALGAPVAPITPATPQPVPAPGEFWPELSVEEIAPQSFAPAPQPIAPQVAAQPTQTAPPPEPKVWKVPTGSAVWSGESDFGMTNRGHTLWRDADGKVHRYTPEYDYVSVYHPDENQWRPGDRGILSGFIDAPSDGGILRRAARTGLGYALGGVPGMIMAQPEVGNTMRRGIRALTAPVMTRPAGGAFTAAPVRQSNYSPVPGFPAAPPGGPTTPVTYSQSDIDRMNSISPAATQAVLSGQAGLF